MKLLVPTNWDPNLILPLSKLEADVQIYGVLPTSMIGSEGTGPDNIRILANQVEEYIEEAARAEAKGELKTAREWYLKASEQLFNAASPSSGKMKAIRVENAEKLLEKAKSLKIRIKC